MFLYSRNLSRHLLFRIFMRPDVYVFFYLKRPKLDFSEITPISISG